MPIPSDQKDRTGIIVPPPLLFAGPFLVGWLIGRRFGWQLIDSDGFAAVIGVVVAAVGIAIAASGVWQFRRARTTVLPFGGTSRIVETGIYRWTRNPMYLGMAFAYAGFAFLINSAWTFAFLPVSIVLVQLFVIRYEERYLAIKFGDAYKSYRSRVRRWF